VTSSRERSPADGGGHTAAHPAPSPRRTRPHAPPTLPPSGPGGTPARPGCCSTSAWGTAGSGPPCTPPLRPTSSRQSACEAARPRRPGSSPPRLPGSSPPRAPGLQRVSAGCRRSGRVWPSRCFALESEATRRRRSKAAEEEHVYSPPSSRSQSACCCVQGPWVI